MVRLVVFALFFYLLYFLFKYMFIKPFKEGYNQSQGSNTKSWKSPFTPKKEGEVSISYNPLKNKKGAKNVGEYIDYS